MTDKKEAISQTAPNLPQTKATSAEERLEELVNHKSVRLYYLLDISNSSYYLTVDYNDCRLYPDGFEAVILVSEKERTWEGRLHIPRRNAFVYYSLKIEQEKQLQKT